MHSRSYRREDKITVAMAGISGHGDHIFRWLEIL